jgi:Trp operon repressor
MIRISRNPKDSQNFCSILKYQGSHEPAKQRPFINHEIANLYKRNLSLRDIAKELNLSKTTIRKHLLKEGVLLRPKDPTPAQVKCWRIRKTKAPPPFGYCYFQGELVKNPIEYDALLKIHRQWKSGMNANEITRYLNAKKIKPRKAKEWHNKAVKKIVARFESKKIVIKGEKI